MGTLAFFCQLLSSRYRQQVGNENKMGTLSSISFSIDVVMVSRTSKIGKVNRYSFLIFLVHVAIIVANTYEEE